MIIESLCCFIYVYNVIFVQILEDLSWVQALCAGTFLYWLYDGSYKARKHKI